MKTTVRKTAELGELVVVAFDMAALYSTDPREVSRLATLTVTHLLQRGWRTSTRLPPVLNRRPRFAS